MDIGIDRNNFNKKEYQTVMLTALLHDVGGDKDEENYI